MRNVDQFLNRIDRLPDAIKALKVCSRMLSPSYSLPNFLMVKNKKKLCEDLQNHKVCAPLERQYLL